MAVSQRCRQCGNTFTPAFRAGRNSARRRQPGRSNKLTAVAANFCTGWQTIAGANRAVFQPLQNPGKRRPPYQPLHGLWSPLKIKGKIRRFSGVLDPFKSPDRR
jgi:hypothetical protein